jgi:uncharacterized protein DUF4411
VLVDYSIDTSSLVEAWHRRYPVDVFPALWDGIDRLISSPRLLASDEVFQEIKKKDDDLYEWVKARPGLFRPLDREIQAAVREVLRRFPRLINTQRGRNQADPFVIALAQVEHGTVVTNEVHLGSIDRPRIPDVCDALGVPCINVLGLIRREGWRFGTT